MQFPGLHATQINVSINHSHTIAIIVCVGWSNS